MNTFELTTPRSVLYIKMLDLRYRVLRKPLGLEFDENIHNKESKHFHLGILSDTILLGCLVLEPINAAEIKMRQVAVEPEQQSLGLGKKLVQYAETVSISKNYTLITLCARENVIPFYEKLGYTVCSETFLEIGIPHKKMQKRI